MKWRSPYLFKSLATLFLLCAIPLQEIRAQADPPDILISLEYENIRLKDLLEHLEKEYNLTFSYSESRINASQKRKYRLNEVSTDSLMHYLALTLNVNINKIEDVYVITPANDNKSGAKIINGFVTDTESGEFLPGASVVLPATGRGVVTNDYGYFSLTVPEDVDTVAISFMGYQPRLLPLAYFKGGLTLIKMNPEVKYLGELVINSTKGVDYLEIADWQNQNMPINLVREMPALFGVQDVVKSLQSVPGVRFFNDGSVFYHVRGGERDQNLILIDDAPIYNPSHAFGIFSTILPEAARDIQMYRTYIPAHLGGRISSVLDVITNEGNMNEMHLKGNVGVVASNVSVEGPIQKGKSSFFLSGRRSHFNGYLQGIQEDISDFYFYDVNAKINFRLGKKDRIYLSAYKGNDFFNESDSTGIEWGNIAGTVRWNHVFNPKLFANTTLYSSNYDYNLYNDLQTDSRWNSHIANVSVRSDLTWFLNPNNTVTMGFEVRGHNFNPGNVEGVRDTTEIFPFVSPRFAREISFFIDNDQKIGDDWLLSYGLRFTNWANLGESFEYTFDENREVVDTTFYAPGEVYNNYSGWEPRISISRTLTKDSRLQLAYMHTRQYTHLISNTISPFTNLEVWLPSGPNLKPQSAHHITLGYHHFNRDKDFVFSAETYFKKFDNQIGYEAHADLLLNPELEGELLFGEGHSYGVELSLKKQYGRLHGSVFYVYSRAFKQINGINNGEKYPTAYDRPHDLSLVASYHVNERVQIGANFSWMSGAAISTPSGFFEFNGYTLPYYESIHNDRLPEYHRLDLNASFRLNKTDRGFRHWLEIGVFNLYGRQNPIYINFNKQQTESGGFEVPSNLIESPTYIATKAFLYRIVPSVNYRFEL